MRIVFGILVWAVVGFLVASCAVQPEYTGRRGRVAALSGEYVLYEPGDGETLSDVARTFYGDRGTVWRIEDANGNGLDHDFGPLVIPLKEKRIGGLFDTGFQGVPVLCYHQFGIGSNSSMIMPPDDFDNQMRYLKDNAYRVISSGELQGFLDYKRQIPKKAVIISIDDGYRSIYDVAYPILKKYGFTATLFVYTNYIGLSSKALSWEDLRFLKKEGFTIGSHSVSHSDLTRSRENETDSEKAARLWMEVMESKRIIDRELGQDTFCFSFPFGRSDERVMTMVKEAGYTMAFSVDRGTNPFFSNPLDLHRDMILKRDMVSFISRLITFNPVSLR
ncbi:MAG: polysaccharide deacetylase family protein [Pseudomonadota bacterium]